MEIGEKRRLRRGKEMGRDEGKGETKHKTGWTDGGDSLHSIIPVDVQHPLSNISMSHGTHKLTPPCTQPTLLQHHPGGIHVN